MRKHTSHSSGVNMILVTGGILFLVIVLVSAIGISMLNPQSVANIAESKLTELIGQKVTIDSIDINLGTITLVRVENVSVANPPWASDPSLASVDILEIGIDMFGLLGGDLVLTEVQMVEPVVHLERSAQYGANWITKEGDRSGNADQAPVSQSKDGGVPNLPRIESLSVDNGLLTYVDPNDNTSLELSLKSNDRQALTGQGSIVADGSGHLLGQPMKINLSAGPPPMPEEKETNGYPLKLRFSSTETMLLIEGKVDAPISPETADLQFSLEGQNLSRWNEALNMELPTLPTYQLSGQLQLNEGVWSLDPIKATVLNSDLTGTLWFTPKVNPPLVEGVLSSERLDIAQLQGFMPQQQDSGPVSSQVARLLNRIANTSVQTNIRYQADLIQTDETPISDVEIRIKLEDNTLSIEPLSITTFKDRFKLEAHISADNKQEKDRIHLMFETVQSSGIATGPEIERTPKPKTALPIFPGNLTVELGLNVTRNHSSINKNKSAKGDSGDSADRIKLESADIQNFHVRYVDPSSNTQMVARLDEGLSEKDIVIEIAGQYHNQTIESSLTVPGIQSFMKSSTNESPQPLALDLKLADVTATVTGTVVPTWPPTEMELRFLAESDTPATTAALFGVELPKLGKLDMSGSLSKRNHIWKMKNFKSHVGTSNVYGTAMIDTTNELGFQAVLKSNILDIATMISRIRNDHNSTESRTSNDQSAESDSSSKALTGELSIPPWLSDLNGKVSVDVQRLMLPGANLKDVSVKASIAEGQLHIAPLFMTLGGGTIKTRVNLNLNAPGMTGDLRTEIQRVDLDEALTAFGNETSELGTVSGRLALKLPNITQQNKKTTNADALLKRLRIEKVSLQYNDPDLQAKSNLHIIADSFESEIRMKGKVEYQSIPVDVSLTTGSLRQGIENYRSMPVDATLQIRETTVGINGQVGGFFPLETLTTSLRLAGPDLFRFGEAINIPLPHLPPYDLHAQLQRKQLDDVQEIFIFTNLDGTIGDSDVAGKLRVTTGGERPMIFLRLQSRRLDLDDLAGLTGAPPDPEETASAKQQAQAENFEDRDKLLPAKPVDFTQLQKVDADVEYRGKRVQAPDLPLDDFLLKMNLQDGHLQMNQLDFGVGNGTMAMKLIVNARNVPVEAKLKTDFDQVNLSKALASFEVADDSFGMIGGQGTLWMKGESLAEWFGSADGGLYLTMTGGKIDALLVELAGLDFAESATTFLGTNTGVPIDCAYTDLQARSGIVTVKPFIFDTKDTKFEGHGKIDLRQEQLDLTVNPYPKDFTLLSSRGPLYVTGTFKDPSFSVDPSFPFPEFGTEDDSARCIGMIEDLRKARKSDMDKRKINFAPS